jgi:N-acetylglucosaminyldiphosphoundecaprenol N-acetyl-beta-D-mannosaminyltransferase
MTARIPVLGAPLDAVTPAEAVARLRAMLAGETQHHVMTPNNEMLVYAARHPDFLALLNRTALNLPDSTGVAWAMRRAGASDQQRVTGVDTVQRLCAELGPDSPVFFLGGRDNVSGRAAEELKRRNPNLAVAGALEASPRDDDAAAIVSAVNASGAKLLLVAYGAPRQDEWIDRHLAKMPGVRVAMGIGGTFDFIAGRIKRAPNIFCTLGLEWLWRLLQEPSRFPRIFNAVVRFPLLVLRRDRRA